jgi:hypothetical protein
MADQSKNTLYNPFNIKTSNTQLGFRNVAIDSDRLAGIQKKIPLNTNPAFNTNFRLMIPKVRQGIYFCTQVEFPSLTMTPINVSFNRAASLNFFGDKIEQDSLSVKFIVNENYSNWQEMSDWFSKSINYYGFFRDNSQARMNDIVVDSTQLVILNNKKVPKVRISFDGLMITSLGNMPMNSGVSDATMLTCDASFQFTSFDIQEI